MKKLGRKEEIIMPNKYQLVNEMARQTLKDITSTPEN